MSKPDPDTLIDDPEVVGYAGVVLTSARVWQGMFIRRDAFDRVDGILERLKPGMRANGLDPEDPNVLVNALAAGVADALQFGRGSDSGAFLAAISKIKGARYLLIRARDAEGGEGLITTVTPLLAASPRAARSVFESQPDVQAIKVSTFMEAMGRKPGPNH
ncbi:hypothetical protein BHAOGJBA_4496 [Methylobacterium hispanicum]|uniref:Uncharacterized protein n=1 Tax=Methylobacterium hispanicum TaxID=270350 RepID=A0AAV4ZR45_9HYPH|nr:hypothetical protein [Methylobacterium hispanicum]GJD90952.1 hypothetical protein BHAOGJBA_4496 [Methylobacterium hispanicum]